ncbi:antiterminator LoaP [Paenibacillus sp. KS-LC4]|uniref:antiterminator LoaP n=1 Tax=Paenibacillus sp. KS-LC4 TaxID=2979727 RepID=UPI0030CD4DD7
MNWYVLFVETGQEEVVQKFLNLYFDEASLHSVIPKRRVPEKKAGAVKHVLKKIFPGYVLIKTRMTDEVFHTLKKVPKCYKLLNQGTLYSKDEGTYYSKIDEREISLILRLIGDGEIVGISGIYIENSRVSVTSGPLKGMEGIIAKIDRHKKRAKIHLSFMGAEKLIDVGVEILSPCIPQLQETT